MRGLKITKDGGTCEEVRDGKPTSSNLLLSTSLMIHAKDSIADFQSIQSPYIQLQSSAPSLK
jgi:hypothetical protein